MNKIARHEYIALSILLIIFIIALIPSLMTSRAQDRDGLRRQDITYLKRSLEQFYNAYDYYPLIGDANCITTANPDSWDFITTLPHDVRESDGHHYSYCVTGANDTGATGYYLEATLEADNTPGQYFDEDEERKFFNRILIEDNRTLYRVCGGTDTQCEVKSK